MNLEHATWVDDAACASHPLREKYAWDFDKPKLHAEAKKVCETLCPVKSQCLAYAENDPRTEGILGGKLFRVRPKRGTDDSPETQSGEVH